MAGFDHSSPATFHLGAVSRRAALALGVALTAMTAPAQAQMPPGAPPLIQVAQQQSPGEILAQIDHEMSEARTQAMESRAAEGGLTEQARALRQTRIQSEQDRLKGIRADFAKNVEIMARLVGSGSCFGGFLPATLEKTAVDTSTVLVVAKNTTGKAMEFGAGFIAEDSAVQGETHNRVVTARHVVNPDDLDRLENTLALVKTYIKNETPLLSERDGLEAAIRKGLPHITSRNLHIVVDDIIANESRPDAKRSSRIRKLLEIPELSHFEIYGSNGQFLGRMEVVAKGGSPVGKTIAFEGDKITATPNDWAVLRINEGATERSIVKKFDEIRGLKLASVMSPEKTEGISGDETHPAASPGFSGGPQVDDTGRVHAINSAAWMVGDSVTVKGTVAPLKLNATKGDIAKSRGKMDLITRQPLIANPLGDPRLLAALGRAGQGIHVSYDAPLYSGRIHLTPVGMPMGVCAASTTVQGPIDLPMQDVRIHSQGAPAPLEVRTLKDGTVMHYDLDGLLQSARLKDGRFKSYDRGVLISETRPDGSTMEFEGGQPVLHRMQDGSSVTYENGKPMFSTAPNGSETAAAEITTLTIARRR